MGSNPERDWGRPSWPDDPRRGGRREERGCRKTAFAALLVVLAVFGLTVAAAVVAGG